MGCCVCCAGAASSTVAIIAGALGGVLSLSVLLLVGILVRRKHRNRNLPLFTAESAGDEASPVPPGRA